MNSTVFYFITPNISTQTNTGITGNNMCKEWTGVIFLDK
jgi:hypothetical protein